MSTETQTLAAQAAELDWYHVLELPGGVVTRGHFDCRPIVPKVPMPASLAGKRVLDVGTWDGFWAFEMERRGAAEVVAVDLEDASQWDWPPHARGSNALDEAYLAQVKRGNRAYALAHEAYGSKVDRRPISIYDLSPETVGTFDFCFLGTLLMHLRDPVRALDALRSVCTGEAVIADGVDAVPSYFKPRTPLMRLEGLDRPWWWQPNRAGFLRMLRSAGWEIQEATGVYYLPTGPAHPQPPVSLEMAKAAFSAHGRERLVVRFVGVPHVAARVRPG
jgi:tRNA (mo5U34)-methyltransferase